MTVKTRLGWDEKSIVILDVARMVEAAGASALTLHCRTRAQAHTGEADWAWLEKVKKVISIPLIGNGDAACPESIARMFETGCDGVMIGRAAIGNPWIFKQAKHYLKTGELLSPPTLAERIRVCIEHLTLCVEFNGMKYGVIPFRKYYAGYLRGVTNIAKVRADLMRFEDIEDIIKRLHQFIEESDTCVARVL